MHLYETFKPVLRNSFYNKLLILSFGIHTALPIAAKGLSFIGMIFHNENVTIQNSYKKQSFNQTQREVRL